MRGRPGRGGTNHTTPPLTDKASRAGQMAAWPQRRGAGRSLLNVVCAAADQHQITLVLNARSPAAARLYTRCGFTRDQPGHGSMTRLPRNPLTRHHGS